MFVESLEDFWDYTSTHSRLEVLVSGEDYKVDYLLISLPLESFMPADYVSLLSLGKVALNLPDTPTDFIVWKLRFDDFPEIFPVYFGKGINTNPDLFVYPRVVCCKLDLQGTRIVSLAYGEGGEPLEADKFNTIRGNDIPVGMYLSKKYTDELLERFRSDLRDEGYIL